MPNTIAQNKFANHCGVSRQGIAWAVQNKLIAVYKKKINIDHRTTCEYYFKRTGKQLDPAELMKKVERKKKVAPKPPKVKPVKPIPSEPPPEPITAPVDGSPPDAPDQPDDGYALPPGIKCFEDITIHNIHRIPQDLIKKVKELEIAKKAKQDREVKRGELIKRELVKQFTAKLHTVDTNQWKTLEDKIMPELCGMFEVQDGSDEAIKARKLISEEVTKILRFVKRQIDEFFIDNEEVVG
jgi:hypothetical protein